METLLFALGVLIAIGIVALVTVVVGQRGEIKDLNDRVEYYQKWAYESDEKVSRARSNRDELRKVLASAILADKNYLAVDPDTFDALPEDFVISKTTDVGASGDNTILVYQVSPREVGGVKLQNQFL